MSHGKRKKRKPLASRRFIVLWQLYRMKKQVINLVDLVMPHQYPHSIQTHSHELIRILICLTNLKDFGVRLKRTTIRDFTLSIIDKDKQVIIDKSIFLDEMCPDFMEILFEELTQFTSLQAKKSIAPFLSPNEPQSGLIRSLFSAVLARIIERLLNSFHRIDQDGNGPLNPDEDHCTIDTSLFTKLTPLLQLELDINRKQLNRNFRNYLNLFDKELLLFRKGQKTFSRDIIHQVFNSFIQAYIKQQESHLLTFELGELSHSTGNIEDAFTKVFKDQFPKEFKLWRSGLYYFPFFEELALAEYQNKLKVQDIDVVTQESGFFERLLKGDQLSRHRSFNAVKLKTYIFIEIQPGAYQVKSQSTMESNEIQLLEVVYSDRPRYKVYINGNQKEPVYLTKNNKAGEIIYAVAQGDKVSYSYYRKNMDYINHDSNFKLYSQSEYHPTLVLAKVQDEDGGTYIGSAKGITIRMISE